MELFGGRTPNYGDMQKFGCDCYVMIPYEKRRKLDNKAQKIRFIGYDETSKGYHVLDPQTRKMSVVM